MSKISSFMAAQSLLGLLTASYVASPVDELGQRSVGQGFQSILKEGPVDAISANLGQEKQRALQDLFGKLDSASGVGGLLGLGGDTAGNGKVENGAWIGPGTRDSQGRPIKGSESTSLWVAGPNGPVLKWQAPPRARLSQEELTRQVLVGAAQDPELRGARDRAARGDVVITGQGYDLSVSSR